MPHELVPPRPWEIILFSFWLFQHSFSWNYVQLSLQGEKKTFWAASPCSHLSSSSADCPSPSPTTLCPWLDTLSLSWVPQPPPTPIHGAPGWNRSHSGNTKSHTGWGASASCTAVCKFIFTTLANQMQGVQKRTIYMMACIRCCLLAVKIANWLSPGTCTVFLINIHSVTNELLDAVWQRT